jgi:hypothetical protein
MLTRKDLELMGIVMTDEQWEENQRILARIEDEMWEEDHPLDE